MTGFPFKLEFLTTLIKLILPGLVISMIGLIVKNYFSVHRGICKISSKATTLMYKLAGPGKIAYRIS